MSEENLHVIINPASAGGRTARRWPAMEAQIKERFGDFDVSFTDAPFAGEGLCRKALAAGAGHIMVIGGDSTFSEVANGFFDDGTRLYEHAEISFLTSGSGCDMVRQMGWPAPEETAAMLDLICKGKRRRHDVGRMTYQRADGSPGERYFVNVASFGLGGAVADAVNNAGFAKRLGGTFAFFWHTLIEGLKYKNQRVRLQVDEVYDETHEIILVAVAICQYFGGGLKIAPEADPEDGLFDILIGDGFGKPEFVRMLATKVPKGLHIDHPKVVSLRGRKLIATPLNEKPVRHELDGEALGALPSTFEILPGALTIRG